MKRVLLLTLSLILALELFMASGSLVSAGDAPDIDQIRQFGATAPADDYGRAVDSDGNIYVTGDTYGTLPGQTSARSYDAFVIKLSVGPQVPQTTVRLLDSTNNGISGASVMYYDGGWKDFGGSTTTKTMELLPLNDKFRVSYGGASLEKYQNVGSDPIVISQTGQVVSGSGTCTHYYAGGWQNFISGMQLLPLNYKFRFNDDTPETN